MVLAPAARDSQEGQVARIEAVTHVEADPQRVWAVLSDLEGQGRWMKDVSSMTVLSPAREGVGVVVRARTRLFGVTVNDDMVVTEWEPPRVLAARHLGPLIRGVGAFELEPTAHGTHLTWWEELSVPLGGLGNAVVEVVVSPVMERLFRASLANLKRLCESRSVRP
jgi:carbon monoxide dehydrogenase subunit G